MIYEFNGIKPTIAKTAFIAPSAEIIGDVKIGENTSIWFQTLIRGDVNYIRIGDNCNIQDMSLIHVARDVYPVNIARSSCNHSRSNVKRFFLCRYGCNCYG